MTPQSSTKTRWLIVSVSDKQRGKGEAEEGCRLLNFTSIAQFEPENVFNYLRKIRAPDAVIKRKVCWHGKRISWKRKRQRDGDSTIEILKKFAQKVIRQKLAIIILQQKLNWKFRKRPKLSSDIRRCLF